jgi:regulator of protease activity HflC (stomatin/prohibitin superfamily)
MMLLPWYVAAQPDEWLLCIRNGRLVKAGVGISLWRRPGDVVVRFTSTVQRVGFAVTALSRERLAVSLDGFILWSVSPEGEGPFRAFQKLGVVNLDRPPRDLKSTRHLLSTPQHRAFQQLLGAAVQRLSAARSLDELLLRQDALVVELGAQLAPLEQEMGVRIERVELLQVRPTDGDLLRQTSAQVEERVREEAGAARAESRRQELEREKALQLAQEANALEVAKAAAQREELQLQARLDRIRREAEASRDAIAAVASAEEQKSQGVRDHELSRLVAEKVGDALKALPLREARWISVGPDSPAGSLAALFEATRSAISR